jgi:hypothetical protein
MMKGETLGPCLKHAGIRVRGEGLGVRERKKFIR